jgi:formylglycine-generating enzyme required for sulfatase activity
MRKRIFINYRRSDSAPWAGRIHQDLIQRFGRSRMFIDVNTIKKGGDFRLELNDALRETRVMLVLIGPDWLNTPNRSGDRRLHDLEDQVRREIASALNDGTIAVIPVLLEGQTMPDPLELPKDLKELTGRQAVSVSHENFEFEMDGLEQDLKRFFRPAFAGVHASALASLAAIGLIAATQMMPLVTTLAPSFARKVPSMSPASPQPSAVVTWEDRQKERDAWAAARAANTIAGYADYISSFPTGPDHEAAEQLRTALLRTEENNRLVHDSDCKGLIDTTVAGMHTCLAPAQKFRDCATCPELVAIPPGKYTMGAPAEQVGATDVERPLRKITIAKPFAIGKYTVTVEDFKTFVEVERVTLAKGCWLSNVHGLRKDADRTYANPGIVQLGTHPAICVSWSDANRFAAWLSRKTGATYRLPTEAEHEYATRARSMTRFFFGDRPKDLCTYANGADQTTGSITGGNQCHDGVGAQTAAVGSFLPNAFGLYDMIGNVDQWVADCWQPNLNSVASNGTVTPNAMCPYRVVKGGAWNSPPHAMASSARAGYPVDGRDTVGFRVVRELQ